MTTQILRPRRLPAGSLLCLRRAISFVCHFPGAMPTALDRHMSSRAIFRISNCFWFRLDHSGFVAHIAKREDSYDAELGFQLQIVHNIPFAHDSEIDPPPHSFCRVNAYTSKALLRNYFTAISVWHCVSGLLEKSMSREHTPQLVAIGVCFFL